MAPLSSPNFHFLTAHDPLLVALGAQAERYFADDPVTCLMKLRQFSEVLAQLAAAHIGLTIPPRTSQSTLVEMLAAPHRGIINAETRELFDGLRQKGNAATHGEAKGSHGTALHQLKMAHKLAIWFHRSFGKADFKPAPFIPPPDPAKESEQLKAELERLRRKVDEASPQTARTQVIDSQVGVAQQHFNVGSMRKLLMPVMPPEEQRLLRMRLQAALASVENIEQLVCESEEKRAVLERSLLSKAFRGELVPQDPNDEPASVLLERIRAERVASAEAAPTRPRTARAASSGPGKPTRDQRD